MTADNAERDARRPGIAIPWAWIVAVAVVAASAVGVASWRGCGSADPAAIAQREAEEKKKQEEAEQRKQQDPQISRVLIQPAEPPTERQTSLPAVKPGHWAMASQRMKAVYQDFVGQAEVSVVDGRGEVYPIGGTSFLLRSSRPVALVKGRPKEIETTFFVPQIARAMQVATELTDRRFGASMRLQSATVSPMPAYQYHFVILAKEPNRYGFIKALDSVKVPFGGENEFDDMDDPLHYRVVSLDIQRAILLPDNPLTWTSIAYILWDEVDPQLFTPEQQRALVDWLHWGGQLVVSGPDSLDLLKGTFLEPWLPATGGGSRSIGSDDPELAELNRGWLISPRGTIGRITPTAAWSGVALNVKPGSQAVESTGGLLVERPVGRGRIVVSAMQLAERDLINWKRGFESWFNACVLRRPPREYRPGSLGELTLAWADPELADRRLDARLTTGLRYLARDLGVDTNYRYVDVDDGPTARFQLGPSANQPPIREYHPPEAVGGIGTWSDFSATANAAREALVEAAGVEVPGTSFVVLCLATYLIALVPLNWLVFQALGRIEWAWIAAPIIAVAGTMVIVDRARLDIGFVRAQTEIGLLELQPEYPRGHLARYTALYTSLSTTYELDFDSLTTVAAPFPTSDQRPGQRDELRSTCDYRRHDKVRLAGLFVPSNTTRMVHSEQMFTLEGMLRLGTSTQRRTQIENRSQLHLRSAAVLQRTSRAEERGRSPALKGCWIGELRPGESAPVSFLPLSVAEGKALFVEDRQAEQRLLHTPRLNLEPMFRLAMDPIHFEPGEKRLVARVDEVLAGETVSPAASQIRGATLVVAHLEYAPRQRARPDLNTRHDVPQE